MKPKFENGDEVKDRVTGLKGIIVSTTVYLNGCIRYGVQPPVIKDGKPVDSTWFDQGDLEFIKAARVEAVPMRKTGGPQSGESRMPSR